jgi:hypothetical protein
MPRVIGSENLQKDVWFKFIRELLEKRVSNDPEAKPVFQDIGEMTFQFVFNDRKDLSYWQEYDGEKITVHEGLISTQEGRDPTVLAVTDLDIYILTTSGDISTVQATAEELYEISGDQEKLFKSANILPFVYRAFKDMEEGNLLPFKIEREEI